MKIIFEKSTHEHHFGSVSSLVIVKYKHQKFNSHYEQKIRELCRDWSSYIQFSHEKTFDNDALIKIYGKEFALSSFSSQIKIINEIIRMIRANEVKKLKIYHTWHKVHVDEEYLKNYLKKINDRLDTFSSALSKSL